MLMLTKYALAWDSRYQEVKVDYNFNPQLFNAIIQTESSGNPLAFNKGSGARGLGQITPIVVQEWNNFHPKNQYTNEDFLVFPNTDKQVNWKQFKEFTEKEHENTEPLSMRAINTDIKFNDNLKNVGTQLINVNYSNLHAFIMSNKKVRRKTCDVNRW